MRATQTVEEADIIQLSHREFLKIDRDYERSAELASLVYVNVNAEGIVRIKKGRGFTYIFDGRPLKGKKELDRIRKLAIPPAWKNEGTRSCVLCQFEGYQDKSTRATFSIFQDSAIYR